MFIILKTYLILSYFILIPFHTLERTGKDDIRIGGTSYRLRFGSIYESLDLGLIEQVLDLVNNETTIPYPIGRFVLSLPDPELRRFLRIRLPKEVRYRLRCQNPQHGHRTHEAQGKVFFLVG